MYKKNHTYSCFFNDVATSQLTHYNLQQLQQFTKYQVNVANTMKNVGCIAQTKLRKRLI